MSQAQTPPSTTSSHSPASPDPNHRIVRKRNRIPLSCGPCRSRKLKCNRSHPCDNCIKRGDTPSCTYAQPGNRLRKPSSNGSSTSPDEMQNRIDRLESLVLSLMTNGSQAPGQAAAQAALAASAISPPLTDQSQDTSPSDTAMRLIEQHNAQHAQQQAQSQQIGRGDDDSDIEAMSRSIGVMKVQNDRQFFASEAHWWAILSDIAEVKRYFEEHKKQYDEQLRKVKASKPGDTDPGTSIMFKGVLKTDRQDLLSQFPSRPVANALIQRYFDSEYPGARFLHGPQFKTEYERHWNNPQQTSIVWLGMCYAMMALALQSYQRVGDEPQELRGKSWAEALHYLELTSQCLVHSDFTQPHNYLVETLCLYMQVEFNRSRDTETGVWMLCGMVVRMAMRVGLHKDAAPYASITPFMAEMRRRLWCFIRGTDVILSMQVGLPHMLRSSITDTEVPSNLYDNEFNVDSKVLPPSRPGSDCTPMSFMIAHAHLLKVLTKILEHCFDIPPGSYENALALDADLTAALEKIPTQLRLKTREEAAFDSASLLMERYMLDLTYHKACISLHRKYIARARDNSRYNLSRRKCIDSCMQMLSHQVTLHAECQPGRRLGTISWTQCSSVNMSDFLLAAMIVCLDLYHTAQAESRGQTSGEYYEWAVEQREPMFGSLERALALWDTMRDQSMEAYKAGSVLSVMLEKLKTHHALRAQLGNNLSFQSVGGGVSPDARQIGPEQSAAMTLGLMSSGLSPEAISMYDRQQRSGMTPQPSSQNGDAQPQQSQQQQGQQQQAQQQQQQNVVQQEGMSPFSNLFAPGSMQGMDVPSLNFDWDAWDTYVQGNTGGDAGVQNMMFDPALADNIGGYTPQPDNKSWNNGGASGSSNANLFAQGQ